MNVRPILSPMPRRIPLLLLALALGPGAAAAEAPFSQSLTAAQLGAAGLDRLSATERTMIDSLVAREQAYGGATERFVESQAPDRRRRAGLDRLTPAQTARLDALVLDRLRESHAAPASAATVLSGLVPETVSLKPQLHGAVGFGFAAGSHGYSAYGGSIALDYADPAKGYDVSAFHSETWVRDALCGSGSDKNAKRTQHLQEDGVGLDWSW